MRRITDIAHIETIKQMRTCIKKNTIHGIDVESWYNETLCNWEAYIKGTGSSTAPCDRGDAIASVITLHESTFCPCCGNQGKLGIMKREDEKETFVGLGCIPCQYAQKRDGLWYFIVGGLTKSN
jgi:hypothetical protein